MKELAIAWLSMMVTVAVVGQGTADKTSADDPCIHTQDCKAFTGYSSRAPFVQASQGSPIMIPLDPGTDCTTQLTDPEHGITWDFNGNYHPVRIAWLKTNARCGWLAIRDDKGHIYNGHQLVGNIMWQPLPEYPKDYDSNGFYALWEYDRAEMSGNGDGAITSADGIWNKTGLDGQPDIGVWEDVCHCGQFVPSDPNRTVWHSLDSLGVTRINLKFEKSNLTDKYGNTFRVKGTIMQNGEEVTVYDAFLQELL